MWTDGLRSDTRVHRALTQYDRGSLKKVILEKLMSCNSSLLKQYDVKAIDI